MSPTRPAIIDPAVQMAMLGMPTHTVWTILLWVASGRAYWEGNRLCRMEDGYPIMRVLSPTLVVMNSNLPPPGP